MSASFSNRTDIQNEARILSVPSTPAVCLWNIYKSSSLQPCHTQFHGIVHETVTLYKELKFQQKVKDGTAW